MYFITLIGLTIAAPLAATLWQLSTGYELRHVFELLGLWTAFFATGLRLFIAGARQVLQPGVTLRQIFEIEDEKAGQVVQELGFANLAMGALGLISLLHPMLAFAAALVGALFHGLAGLKYFSKRERSAERTAAMVTDLWVAAVLALYVWLSGVF